jgi:energy-coupling factor transport system substrate-specific component
MPITKYTASKYLLPVFFIIISVIINVCGSLACSHSAFPLYLDSLTTIAVAALYGLIPALIVAAVSNLGLACVGIFGISFMACHLITALLAWIVFHLVEKPFTLESFMWAGFFSALSNGVLGSILSQFIYKGATPISQVNNVVQGIFAVSHDLTFSIYCGGIVSNMVDKAFSALVSYGIYKLIRAVHF